MINEFIENHIDFIDRPISRGRFQGFLLKNGFRILFSKSVTLTKDNGKKLSRLYEQLFFND